MNTIAYLSSLKKLTCLKVKQMYKTFVLGTVNTNTVKKFSLCHTSEGN